MSEDGYSYTESTVTESVAESAVDEPEENDATERQVPDGDGDQEQHKEEEEEKHWSQDDGKNKVIERLQSELAFPSGFETEDLLKMLENIDVPQEFNQEALDNYHNECMNVIKEELIPEPEKPEEDDEEVMNLKPEFIAERLSDLQEVEGEHLSFAFTSFGVQEAEIYDIKALAEFRALLFISMKKNIISDATGLSGLPMLRELHLNENKLVSFSDISLPSLEVLNLSQNKFRTLGKLNLPKLKKLILSQNQICFISPQAFTETPELEELTLSENKLKSFKPGTFKNLAKLTVLKLDQNAIADLPEGIFEGLAGLKRLELGENPTESIAGIAQTTALEFLDIHGTGVGKLEDMRPLIDCKELKAINVDGAPVLSAETFKSDMILMLPWLETIDEEPISFSDRQEALALDEERKAEEERLRKEAEQAEKETEDGEEDQEDQDDKPSEAGTEDATESYATYDSA